MSEEVLRKFGKYFLLDKIAQGGMAEIYRARLASTGVNNRLLVVKRIQPAYGENREFLEMFKSEIKVTFGFNHPNVVQIYDFSVEDNQHYIAMEYIDGKNLRQVLNAFQSLELIFPVELSVFLIEQVAAGLAYAHNFKDKMTGQSLNIIHRDVSPHNILISYDGNVKIIDFGIAKASTNSESTRAGVLKGKLNYFTPEQVNGEGVDARTDIFALGIVLWELLTGKRLFHTTGDNEFAVLKMIESCQIYTKPPSSINSDVPKELDYIVLKALAKQREKRYQTAEEFQRALHKFLYSYSPDFNPGDLSLFVKRLFKNEIIDDRKQLQSLNQRAEKLLTQNPSTALHTRPTSEISAEKEHYDKVLIVQPVSVETPPVAEEVPVFKREAMPESPLPEATSPSRSTLLTHLSNYSNTEMRARESRKAGIFFKVAAVFFVAAGAVFFFLGPRLGVSVSDWSLSKGWGAAWQQVRSLASQGVAAKKSESSSSKSTVQLALRILPDKKTETVVYVNGKNLSSSYLEGVRVVAEEPIELVVERFGYKSYFKSFSIQRTEGALPANQSVEVQLEELPTGYFSAVSQPRAQVFVYALNTKGMIIPEFKPLQFGTPLERQSIPVGSYRVVFQYGGEEERQMQMSVAEGQTVVLRQSLKLSAD